MASGYSCSYIATTACARSRPALCV
jgi:hypothetical protein